VGRGGHAAFGIASIALGSGSAVASCPGVPGESSAGIPSRIGSRGPRGVPAQRLGRASIAAPLQPMTCADRDVRSALVPALDLQGIRWDRAALALLVIAGSGQAPHCHEAVPCHRLLWPERPVPLLSRPFAGRVDE